MLHGWGGGKARFSVPLPAAGKQAGRLGPDRKRWRKGCCLPAKGGGTGLGLPGLGVFLARLRELLQTCPGKVAKGGLPDPPLLPSQLLSAELLQHRGLAGRLAAIAEPLLGTSKPPAAQHQQQLPVRRRRRECPEGRGLCFSSASLAALALGALSRPLQTSPGPQWEGGCFALLSSGGGAESVAEHFSHPPAAHCGHREREACPGQGLLGGVPRPQPVWPPLLWQGMWPRAPIFMGKGKIQIYSDPHELIWVFNGNKIKPPSYRRPCPSLEA